MNNEKSRKEKITEWLNETGFPLEMETANAFRHEGFDIRQSYTYADPETGKGREIDVLAVDPEFIGLVQVNFLLECKSSKNPWIVLTSDDAMAYFNRIKTFGILNIQAIKSLKKFGTTSEKRFGLLQPFLFRDGFGGYGFRQAFSRDNDPAYQAAISALKAAYAYAYSKTNHSTYQFAFPVIVVDSPLYECNLGIDKELVLTEVLASEFLFSAHIPDNVSTCVKVIHKSYLPEFAKWAVNLVDTVHKQYQTEEDAYLNNP